MQNIWLEEEISRRRSIEEAKVLIGLDKKEKKNADKQPSSLLKCIQTTLSSNLWTAPAVSSVGTQISFPATPSHVQSGIHHTKFSSEVNQFP